MPIEHEDSNFVSHEPCDKCGSRDGNSPLVRRASLLLRLRDIHTPRRRNRGHRDTTPPTSSDLLVAPPERYPPEV